MAKNDKIINWGILLALSLIWGTSFILIKKGLRSFSTFQVASLRVFITYIVLLPVSIRHIKKINRHNITDLIIIGVIGNAFPAFLFPAAQTHLDSSVAGMLNSLTPVFTFFIGIFLYRRKAFLQQVAGIILGLAGAAGLIYNGSLHFNYHGLLIVVATLFYGVSSNQVTRIKDMNGLVITSLAFFFIGPLSAISLATSDFGSVLSSPHWLQDLAFISILAVVGSALALALFNILILRTSPVFATTVTYLAPIVATIWGFNDGENITSFMVISILCIFAGVYLINRKRNIEIAKADIGINN